MENDKTIEEIFKDVTDTNRLQYLKEKLGQVKKDKNDAQLIKTMLFKSKFALRV